MYQLYTCLLLKTMHNIEDQCKSMHNIIKWDF